MGENWLLTLGFAAYLALLAWIAWRAWRHTRDIDDFILGGRRLGRWSTALSAGASDMSGWLLLGLPGYAYLAGLEALWLVGGLALGAWLNWRLVAARLRAFSLQYGNALTLPEYLHNRVAARTRLLRVVTAGSILLFFLIYTASGLVAAGKLFETVFALPYHWAVALGLASIVLYTVAGGFLAVSWSDVLQALLMLIALVLVPLLALGHDGSATGFNPDALNPLTNARGEPLDLVAIASLAAWGLGYFGQPHILARFKGSADQHTLVPARRIGMSWVVITLICATLVGLLGQSLLPGLGKDGAETVFLRMVGLLFHPVVAGLLLCAVLAAIMSTADSQLLVASSSFVRDLYRRGQSGKASDRRALALGRTTVVVIAIIALAMAWDRESTVLGLVAYAWAGLGASMGPVVLLSLYWRGLTEAGALAGVVAGGTTVVIWRQFDQGIFALYELVPGFVCALLATILVSRFTRPGEHFQEAFAEARARLSQP